MSKEKLRAVRAATSVAPSFVAILVGGIDSIDIALDKRDLWPLTSVRLEQTEATDVYHFTFVLAEDATDYSLLHYFDGDLYTVLHEAGWEVCSHLGLKFAVRRLEAPKVEAKPEAVNADVTQAEAAPAAPARESAVA